jgi:thiamine pyrophosphate-dependent acetolactate synthase large subunit-like protein
MALGVLTTIGRYKPPNLTVIVLDNGSFSTFGDSMITATAAGTDLAAVARACGLDKTLVLDTLEQSETAMPKVLREPGPWIAVAKVDSQARPDPRFTRNSPDVTEQSLDFSRMLRRNATP